MKLQIMPAPERAANARIAFSFGRNWKSFARFASPAVIQEAQGDIVEWLGSDPVSGKSVIDVGCGSGIHSLGLYQLGARKLVSIDVDPHSVECTRRFWQSEGRPPNWTVGHGNVLDADKMANLGQFDIVYSWGVLHHTGRMWEAIDNASCLAKPANSRLWLSIYAKGPDYPEHLKIKQRFNSWPWWKRQAYVLRFLYRRWRGERRVGKRFREWFWRGRGMNAYHDAMDWFGGLPYEVASVPEMTEFFAHRGWVLDRVKEASESACSIYLFRR